ncbi:MAG: hypothetical protein ACR2HK_06315 [Gemmatimonadales bacterium]
MSGEEEVPRELSDLNRSLGGIRFEPRSSLGPELRGRVRRGERAKGAVTSRRVRPALWGVAAALVASAALLGTPHLPADVRVDRCCYDLDGGGEADDGVLVVAGRDEQVRRLSIYEDRDGSAGYSLGDLVRFERGAEPMIDVPLGLDLETYQFCCLDYDGGGFDDDGLLVVGRPPDRVVMAAIYETHRTEASAPLPRFPLR